MKTSKSTGANLMTISEIERVVKRIDITDTCWEWRGAKTKKGYSETFNRYKGVVYLHRLIYELIYGSIPQNMVVDHVCENVGCCNPKHLNLLSNGDNIARKYKLHPASHCKNGHEYGPNTITRTRKQTGRIFRECQTCRLNWY